MSYLAIARKYRPATFDEIVGQEHVTRTLRNAIERERIHHAFLFTGARGVGKTTAARALARSLNCEKGPTADPCGTCQSCIEITGGRSPDLIEIDGASNNSVEDIRDLRETVRYAPTQGRWKIYLIDEVHMLSKGAFNALLKTLEEPPPHVVFIFATTEPNRIPDTILSRVQRFDFKRIGAQAVSDRLRGIAEQEGVKLSDHALKLIARAGEGSMRDAQSLLDQVISFAGPDISDDEVAQTLGLIDRSLLHGMLEGLVTGRPDLCLDAIDEVYRYGYELSQFTAELLEVLRDATFLRLSQQVHRHVDLSDDDKARLIEITEGVEPEVLTRAFNALLEVHDQVSRASRPRVVLEMAVARLATIRPIAPVAALVARLEGLEATLRRKGASAPTAGYRQGPQRRQGTVQPKTHVVVPPAPVAPAMAPPAPAKAGVPTDPWAAFTQAIRGVRHAEDLIGAQHQISGDRLVLVVSSVRVQALCSRCLAESATQTALATHFPGLEPDLRVRPTGVDPAIARREALKQQAMTDPAVRRIVETLGADLDEVTPAEDGDST